MLWLHDHHFEEWLRFYKFETASDKLVALGKADSRHAPGVCLSTKRGANLAVAVNKQMLAWKDDIPYLAYLLREELHHVAGQERESKSRAIAYALVDVILTKAAWDRTPNVMLGFEIAQVGVKCLTGAVPTLQQIRRVLDRLRTRTRSLSVEFNKKGNFGKTTKVNLTFVTHSSQTRKEASKNKAIVDEWLLDRGNWVVRAEKHQTHLRETLADRKAEYAAKMGEHIALDMWIRDHTVIDGKHLLVEWPGVDLISPTLVGISPGRALPEITMVTSQLLSP
jgi:hypothetical protein